MKKVLIVQTGSIDYVADEYYERYKLEGIILVPEEGTEEALRKAACTLAEIALDNQKITVEEAIKIAAAPLEEIAKEIPKVVLDAPKVAAEELKVQTKGLKLPKPKRVTKVK